MAPQQPQGRRPPTLQLDRFRLVISFDWTNQVRLHLGEGVNTVEAKALLDYFRELRRDEFVVKGGYMGGRIFSAADVTALSKVPPRPVVLAQALGTIQAPLNNFAGTMNGILGEFARTLQALSDKRQAEGA